MNFEIDTKIRGLKRITFKDLYKQKCSMQESSLIIHTIWLGVELDLHDEEAGRMILTQKMAWNLIKYLFRFVITGKL